MVVLISKIACTAALLASYASAHTIFQELWVNGVSQGHLTGIRYPTYDGPINDVTSPNIICNGAAGGGQNVLHTPFPTDVINVPSGGQLTLEWHHTLTSAGTGDSEDPVATGHNGPIMAYLAAVPDARTPTVTGLNWFKVYEDGLDQSTKKWAVQKLIDNKGKVSFSLPSCIPAGNYFLRGELIALHAAGSSLGAQFYMECAQINIVGGGSASPPTVSFPGAYKQNDPGVLINIYNPPVTNYIIPGPRPFTCGAGGTSPATTTSAAAVPTTSSAKPVTTTTSSAKPVTTTTSSAKPATTSASTGGTPVAAYGQCGGSTYTGSVTCVSGYKCVATNQYYSQCVPS